MEHSSSSSSKRPLQNLNVKIISNPGHTKKIESAYNAFDERGASTDLQTVDYSRSVQSSELVYSPGDNSYQPGTHVNSGSFDTTNQGSPSKY